MRATEVLPSGADLLPHRSTALSTASQPDPRDELVDLVEDHVALGHLLLDLVDGIHDRGVVATAEGLRDARVAQVGELAHHVHADLAGGYERPAPALATQLVGGPAEHLGGLVE